MGCFSAPADRCLRVPKIRRQTGNRIWNLSGAAILCIPKRAENFSQQLHDHCVLCKKDFPLFDCRYDGFTENARPGIDGCASEMAYPAGIDYSFVCNRPVLPSLERRNRLYSRCHEAPQYSWNAKNRVPVSADNDFCNYNSRGTLCCRSYTGH